MATAHRAPGHHRAAPRAKSSRRAALPIITDPVASAASAGLRHIAPEGPGLRRRRVGKGFAYYDADGHLVRDRATLTRVRALALPPAWRDVWICPRADGHIQAVGRDAKGRKQYRYHARWREVRDETKYNRMLVFGAALPKVRASLEAHLALPGLPREKVLATVVRLLEATLIRVGNEEYARTNHSFGLTTLQNRHVQIHGATMLFSFRGKSGVRHAIPFKDRRLARILARCRDLPGYELFQYVDESGDTQRVDSADVNDYLRQVSGEDFTAKDFRTLAGTVHAALTLREMPVDVSATERKRFVVQAIERVAERLGNTPTVCRKCYVHPEVVSAYLDGTLATLERVEREESAALTREAEEAVLRFLEARLTGALIAKAAA